MSFIPMTHEIATIFHFTGGVRMGEIRTALGGS